MKNYASRENCDSRAWWILAPKHNLPTVKPDDSSLLLILCICCYRFRKILLFKFQDFWLNKQLLKTIFNHPSVRSGHQLNLTFLFSSSPTPFIFIMRLWNYLIFCFVLYVFLTPLALPGVPVVWFPVQRACSLSSPHLRGWPAEAPLLHVYRTPFRINCLIAPQLKFTNHFALKERFFFYMEIWLNFFI